MPWTGNDAEKHTHKATTSELKELWAKVANVVPAEVAWWGHGGHWQGSWGHGEWGWGGLGLGLAAGVLVGAALTIPYYGYGYDFSTTTMATATRPTARV
jgi:hypothetical protein